jgi:acyl-CoA synthetase (AMP-forming)/AMP-acid ligase II
MLDFQNILDNGTIISSSGTSGAPKEYFQTPEKLLAACKVAVDVNQLTRHSKVYTCCKLTHAGGLLAQTLPAFTVGAHVDIEKFSAYEFVKKIRNYTHGHITPLHAKAIMLTKNFHSLDLTGVTIMCGADPVTWDVIEALVSKGAKVIVNWGMSEIGPVAINLTFNSMEEVIEEKNKAPANSTLMGKDIFCDHKIVNGELLVKGDICIYDDWYATKDKVIFNDGRYYYTGRTNVSVDLNAPKKG